MFKVMTAREAAELVRDGDLIAFNGMVFNSLAVKFFEVLRDRYAETGHPGKLRYMASTGFGACNQWAEQPGMVRTIYAGHWRAYSGFYDLVAENKIEAYNLPQGIIALNYRAAAAHLPGVLSRAGLKTFIDPRLGGGAYNEISREVLSEVQVYNGREYLLYYTHYPDVCVLRGTTCDPYGNITFEMEGGGVDALAMAQAAHNNGGKVIVQVARLSEKAAYPYNVLIPGSLVDAVYVEEDWQMLPYKQYDPLFSGETRVPEEEVPARVDELLRYNLKSRNLADRVIARRAALEIRPGNIVNMGSGLPMTVFLEAYSMGRIDKSVTASIESGSIGGVPVGYFAFSSNLNVGAFISQNQQFDFYEGGGIDVSCVGALEIDRAGNVNVTKKGRRIFGTGGFNHVSTSPKKLLVCTKIGVGSDAVRENGKIVFTDGAASKFCEAVDYIVFAAERAIEEKQTVYYITERGVFRLTPEGLELFEAAPGIDVRKDILAHIPFPVKVAEDLAEMPAECFNI